LGDERWYRGGLLGAGLRCLRSPAAPAAAAGGASSDVRHTLSRWWRRRAADKLSRYWAGQKLPVQPGATRGAVKQFETTYGVSFPAEIRDYFLKHDGMSPYSPYDKDKNGFSFWELSRVRPAAEELAEAGPPHEAGPELDHYFVFADYLDWSWAYAIRLTSDPLEGGRVVMLGMGGVPPEIASSFGEFVDLVIRDSPRLYPVKP
jgi:hypothetical protein